MEPTQMQGTTIRFGRTAWARIRDAAQDEGVSAAQYVREAALMRAFMQEYKRDEPVSVAATEVADEVLRLSREIG